VSAIFDPDSALRLLLEELSYCLVSLGYLGGLIHDAYGFGCSESLIHALHVFGMAVNKRKACVGTLGLNDFGCTCVRPFQFTTGQVEAELEQYVARFGGIQRAGHEIWASPMG